MEWSLAWEIRDGSRFFATQVKSAPSRPLNQKGDCFLMFPDVEFTTTQFRFVDAKLFGDHAHGQDSTVLGHAEKMDSIVRLKP